MQTQPMGTRQEVPADFADQLRALLNVDNPLLGALLAASRDKGWSAPALAAGLQMNPPAVSKRVERARIRGLDERLTRELARFRIPEPEHNRVMLDGRRLPGTRIAELQRKQKVASRINGATPADHNDRKVSEELAAELNQLVNVEHFSPYYLAGEIGTTHRAITSRLERHGYRTPCPSVAGTASGVYHRRRIGDPGQGAPRLTREQRAVLRGAWVGYRGAETDQERSKARFELRELLLPYLAGGFTLANLAGAISTKDIRVRYPQLRQVLDETNWTDPDHE
jgi:hypothetical protein